MAAVFGRIDEFDSKKEDWPQYVERLTISLQQMVLPTLIRSDRSF